MELYDYQQRTLDDLDKWFQTHQTGNPLIVLPTGSGKAFVSSTLVKNTMSQWPFLRMALITHSSKLIDQNAKDLQSHWPNAPLGICCAGLKRNEIGEPILYGTIGSVRKKVQKIGHIDLLIVDECHLIHHKNQGMYRIFINDLLMINPHMRVVGFTATPYRMSHGMIVDGVDALFHKDMIIGATIEELIFKKKLATLHSKHTKFTYDVKGLKKRDGDFVEKDLQERCNTDAQNIAAVDEIIARAGNRRHWLIFCTGIDHAVAVAAIFESRGISSACVLGKTPERERDRIFLDFESRKIKVVTNVDVWTIGFNLPDLDLIAFLRPTESRGLYEQMAGRGTRLKSHTDHCLVLDFAGNIERHGPITVTPEFATKGEGDGIPPLKSCPSDKIDINGKSGCDEIIHISIMTCPMCGYVFPPPEKKIVLHNDNIMKIEGKTMMVSDLFWKMVPSKKGGYPMVVAEFTGHQKDDPKLAEFFCVAHPPSESGSTFARDKGIESLTRYLKEMGLPTDGLDTLNKEENMGYFIEWMNKMGKMPSTVEYIKDGKFWKILSRNWNKQEVLPQTKEQDDDGW